MIRGRSVAKSGSFWTSSASVDDAAAEAKAALSSAGVAASTRCKAMPSTFAVASTSANRFCTTGIKRGSIQPSSTMTRDTDGAISCNSSSRFESSSPDIWVKPVMLPPGRAKLATRPSSTGLPAWVNTIGIVRVAACSAAASCEPMQTITVGLRSTISRAMMLNRSGWLSP